MPDTITNVPPPTDPMIGETAPAIGGAEGAGELGAVGLLATGAVGLLLQPKSRTARLMGTTHGFTAFLHPARELGI